MYVVIAIVILVPQAKKKCTFINVSLLCLYLIKCRDMIFPHHHVLLITVIPALACILEDLNLKYSPSVNKRDYLTAFCNRYRLIRTNWYFLHSFFFFFHKGTVQCRSYMVKIYFLAECSFIGSFLNPSKMLIISFNNWNS